MPTYSVLSSVNQTLDFLWKGESMVTFLFGWFLCLVFLKKTDKIIQLIKGKNFRYWLAVIAFKKIWFYERQLHGSVTGINYVDDSIECLSPIHAVKLTFSYLNLSDILIYAKCNVCWVSYICYHVLNAPNRF